VAEIKMIDQKVIEVENDIKNIEWKLCKLEEEGNY
jgi:hypothetical protein